jgi:rod shape determining protein RodA
MRIARTTNPDLALLLAVLGLLAIGLPAIFSASHVTDGFGKVLRQAIWAGAGFVGLGVAAFIDYRALARYWRLFYLVLVLLLVFTLFKASSINGARSWLDLGPFNIQPSEFGKVLLILGFGALLSRAGPLVQSFSVFARGLLFVAVPMLLVLAQPDMGTAFIYGMVWLVMSLAAGVRGWMVLAVLGLVALLGTVAWQTNLVTPEQKSRLDFIHADPARNGYHQRQALVAIGAGQFWGKGFLQGTQAQRGFLPEQDTDFIFAGIGEEFGFFGLAVLMALFLFILLRLLHVIEEAETVFGRVVAAGVFAMLAAHILVNIGMCLKLLPVTGVPLPFVSYGGSNLLTNLIAIGLVLNISLHRRQLRSWANPEETLLRM